MIKSLKNKAVVVGVLLASTFAIPANASDQKQMIWDNTYQTITALDATKTGIAYSNEVDSEAAVVSFRDGRGVGLNANMQLVADIAVQMREATLKPKTSRYSQGAFGEAYASLNDNEVVGELANTGWGSVITLDASPSYGLELSHNAVIMRDGRGVGLVQANLTSDFTLTPTIAAAMGVSY